MALAQLGSIWAQDHGQVDEMGRLQVQGIIQQNVPGSAGEPLLGAEHVGYLHQVVVHHVGQVVGRETVGLYNYEIVQDIGLKGYLSPDLVVKADPYVGRNPEPDYGHIRITPGPGLIFGQVPTSFVVFGRQLFAGLLLPHLIQPGRGAVAVVGIALAQQFFGVLMVDVQPLRLEIGAKLTPDLRALVPVKLKPAKALQDRLGGPVHSAALVGVLYADNETAAVMPGEKPVEQGGAYVAHMGYPSGAGGVADSHLLGHDRSPAF